MAREIDCKALGEFVVGRRHEMALSQREFASRVGISRTTLHAVEAGKGAPSPQVRRKLATALEISPAELWQAAHPVSAADR